MLSSKGYDVKNVFALSWMLVIILSITPVNTRPWAEGSRPPMGNRPSRAVFPESFIPIGFDTLPISGSGGLFPKQREPWAASRTGIWLISTVTW